MKKYVAIILLALSVLACGFGQSSQMLSTQTALASTASAVSGLATQAAWTATPTTIPTPDYTAKMRANGSDLYGGPGFDYPKTGFLSGDVTIIGQAFGCAWFEVVSNSNSSVTGWVGADTISFIVKCSDVKMVEIPPTPQPSETPSPIPSPTATNKPAAGAPPPNVVNCQVNSNIIVSNRSGAPFTLILSGPANFTFYIDASEAATVLVCSGSYNYTIYGTCNGSPATGTGRISDGDQVYFVCN